MSRAFCPGRFDGGDAGRGATRAEQTSGLPSRLHHGGGVAGFVIVVLSWVALALIIEHTTTVRRARILPQDFVDETLLLLRNRISASGDAVAYEVNRETLATTKAQLRAAPAALLRDPGDNVRFDDVMAAFDIAKAIGYEDVNFAPSDIIPPDE